jgi:outer membrane protein assembly factor BamB
MLVPKWGWLAVFLAWAFHPAARGDDWPEWRGAGRRGEWNESGLLERFPARGLRVSWRVALKPGYSGPSVAGGRVFVTDYDQGFERALCFRERDGRMLWTRRWRAEYRGMDYASGPRATPTVDGDRVFVVGARGMLHCLNVRNGAVLWKKDYELEYNAAVPGWGMVSAPVVVGERVIAVVGGRPVAKVVAFDRGDGRELWRALRSENSEPGYSQPVLVQGKRMVAVWHADGVSALDPERGTVLWEHSFPVHMNSNIATPVQAGPYLLVSQFFNGARMLNLTDGTPVWQGKSKSEMATDTLHSLMASPVVEGDHLYGICSYGQLRCLKLATGERVWETQAVTVEKARNASAHIVRNRDRYLFFNDRGELIAARLKPEGYEEISRVKVIRPTSKPGARRELGAVAWSHPAFANGHMIVRNDEEMVRLRLSR